MEHYGQVDASSTLRIFFTTHDKDGGAVAPNSAFEAADVRIYKDGSATQRSSESGYTMTSPFDSVTGLHLLSVDLSDNTDAGFYAAGSQYTVVLSSDETVDSEAVLRVLADFKIGPVSVNVTQFGGSNGTFSGGRPEVNTTHAAGTAWGSGAITAASIATGAIDADAIADNAIDAGAIASDAITSAKIADNAITAAKIAADAITAAKIANGAIDAATFAADVDAEILSYLVDDATRIDASALNTASGAIGSNGSGLTEAGGTGDHLTAVPDSAGVTTLLSRIPAALFSGITSLAQWLGLIAGKQTGNSTARTELRATGAGSGTFDETTDSQEAIRDRGDAAWTTATGFSTHSASDVWSVGTRVLTAGTNIALAKGTGVTGFNDLSAADVRTAVGLASANLDTQLDALPTAAENADAVWDESTTGHTTSGTFGEQLKTDVDAILADTDVIGTPSNLGGGATVAANLSDIESQTDDIGAAGAGLTALASQASVNTIDDFLDTEIAAIKAKTDSLTFTGAGRVDANVAAVNNSTTGVDKLSAHLPAVLMVVVGSGSTTTSVVLNASTGINGGAPSATDDFYNGRVLIFTSGALAGQATSISDYAGSSVTLTVVALTGAPASGVTAVIV